MKKNAFFVLNAFKNLYFLPIYKAIFPIEHVGEKLAAFKMRNKCKNNWRKAAVSMAARPWLRSFLTTK